MQLVHVIPIARGMAKEELSYFTREGITPGMIVRVPIRSRSTIGIVARTETALDAKAKIRHFDFPIKKIESLHIEPFFNQSFMEAVNETARYFASSRGAVLHQLIPTALLNNLHQRATFASTAFANRHENAYEISALQAHKETRVTQYKNNIREAFARGNSVYLCVPTVAEVEQFSSELQKGIEPYVFTFHGSLTHKQVWERFQAMNNEAHPVLIIATGTFFSLPRNDLNLIILEHESSRFFKQSSRPFIDIRVFVRLFAKAQACKLIIGDLPMRVETNYWIDTNHIHLIEPPKSRTQGVADQIIIDMRTAKKEDFAQKKFAVLSDAVKNLLINTAESKDRVFIFNARRGNAPVTLCEDCNSLVVCNHCGTPVVLHKKAAENVFACHKCGATRSAKERCYTCRSWKLKALGIGTKGVKEAVAEIRSDQALFAIDSDATTTHKRAYDVAKTFYETPSAVLVGTEMALPYLQQPIAHTVVASVDSLLLLPDPFVHERVFRLLLDIRALGTTSFILQTRQPDLPLLTEVLEGALKKFYTGELEDRKAFHYPPFSLLIRISTIGTKQKARAEMENVKKQFGRNTPAVYPAFIPLGKNKFALHALLRVSPDAWPDNRLLGTLRNLPPHVVVNVAPQSTL